MSVCIYRYRCVCERDIEIDRGRGRERERESVRERQKKIEKEGKLNRTITKLVEKVILSHLLKSCLMANTISQHLSAD